MVPVDHAKKPHPMTITIHAIARSVSVPADMSPYPMVVMVVIAQYIEVTHSIAGLSSRVGSISGVIMPAAASQPSSV